MTGLFAAVTTAAEATKAAKIPRRETIIVAETWTGDGGTKEGQTCQCPDFEEDQYVADVSPAIPPTSRPTLSLVALFSAMDGEDLFASSVAFLPLPFRVLSLVGLGILCWASNLHILHLLGIDAPAVLDARPEKLPLSTPPSPWSSGLNSLSPTSPSSAGGSRKPRSPPTLHESVYRVFVIYAAWVLGCYLMFTRAVQGDMKKMDSARPIIVVAALGVTAALLCPFNVLYKRERSTFLM